MSRAALWCLVGGLATGCGATPEPTGVASHDLLAALVGAWRVEGPVRSDCPVGLERHLPRGETIWTDRSGLLHIASATGETAPVLLEPVGEARLSRTTEVAVPGCTGRETLNLVVEQLDSTWASGLYTAVFSHDGGSSCAQLLAEAELPDRCDSAMDWQARRL